MHGGELFVPKIPSARILDLVAAMGDDVKYDVIGIRPGEKVHEVMCPADDSHLTLEFEDHYVIRPTIRFIDKDIDFKENRLGQKGTEVQRGFSYSSDTNSHFLTVQELRELNERVLGLKVGSALHG
jgi:UDP-N-acetylglucosamine 4,6-dehydratase/5-epimerase